MLFFWMEEYIYSAQRRGGVSDATCCGILTIKKSVRVFSSINFLARSRKQSVSLGKVLYYMPADFIGLPACAAAPCERIILLCARGHLVTFPLLQLAIHSDESFV